MEKSFLLFPFAPYPDMSLSHPAPGLPSTSSQLFKQGGTLSDISTGTEPEYGDNSQIGVIGRSLGESVTKVLPNSSSAFAFVSCRDRPSRLASSCGAIESVRLHYILRRWT